MVIGIIVGFIALCIGLAVLAGFVWAIIWAYKRFIRKDTTSALIPTTPLVFPHQFGWALATALLGFHAGLYSYVTYFGPEFRVPAAGWAVFAFGTAVAWLLLLWRNRNFFVLSTIAALVVLSSFVFLRANGFTQTWNILFFVVSQLLLFVFYIYKQLPISIGGWLGSIIFTVPLTLVQGLRVVRSVFKREGSKSTFLGWVKTGLLAFIVLAIFLGLLSQADPVFAEIMKEVRNQLIGRTLWTLVIIFLCSTWWTIQSDRGEETESQATWLVQRDVVAVLGVVTIVVGIFLVVQFQYLFGGSKELLETLNLTFSEYVRKGFTELLLAVFIGGILAYIAGAKLRHQTAENSNVIWILNTLMVGELGLLLASAYKRDVLYVETYGLTRVRVIGEVFLVWLAFFLVVLLAYAWKKIQEKRALAALWSGVVVVLLAISVVNVDSLVVQGAPGHHQYTDYFYLMQLSEDAAPAWPELLTKIEADTAPLLAKESLSPEEKAQLAGLKLALASFMENRDSLYLKYAPDSWLLEKYRKIGLELHDKNETEQYALQNYEVNSWQNRQDLVEHVSPANVQPASSREAKVIPESLKKYRGWQFTNYAEQRAFTLLTQDEERLFSMPEQLFADILRYQVRTQTELAPQENRLLNELQYQFITVHLTRYYPTYLYNFDVNNWSSARSVTRQAFAELESKSDTSIPELASLSCAAPQVVQPRSFTVYGVAHKLEKVPGNSLASEQQAYSLRILGDTAGNSPDITVLVPVQSKMTRLVPVDPVELDQTKSVYRAATLPLETADPMSGSTGVFVKAEVIPVAVETGSGCSVLYSSGQLQALYAF